MRFIGIDPGKSGGIAVLKHDGAIAAVRKMPDTDQGIVAFLREHSTSAMETRAALEYVRSSPQMGVTSAFTFARGYGVIEGILATLQVPYYDVHPSRWQKMLGCRSGGDKNITKARAAELWPDQKLTHAIADALLIAEWCRRNTLAVKG